jgi:YD repeat-containing protein
MGNGLALDRIWNSMWPPTQSPSKVGIFGPNWRSTYEERMFMGSDGTVKYARADGSFWSFILYGSPAAYHLIAPASLQVSLTPGTNSWTVTLQNGEKRVFDSNSGSLTSITDRNGNVTSLTYDSANRLTTVTDPAGRHLYFAYGAGSMYYLVAGVTSDAGRGISLTYTYDTTQSQPRLIRITRPDNTFVTFSYDANSFISSVLDADGKVLESHTYDNNGRGLSSSRANGVDRVTVTYPTQ